MCAYISLIRGYNNRDTSLWKLLARFVTVFIDVSIHYGVSRRQDLWLCLIVIIKLTAGFEYLATSHHSLRYKDLGHIPFVVLSCIFNCPIAQGELGNTLTTIQKIFIFAVVSDCVLIKMSKCQNQNVKINLTNIKILKNK